MKKITLLFSVVFLIFYSANGQVVINELVSSNTSANTDEDGSHEDWIEIYNAGASTVNLNGYGLSDDAGSPLKWKFPDITIDAQAYMLIWCSDKNRITPGNPLHTNWKISASGEAIYLSDAAGTILDNSPSSALLPDISFGRLPNGSGGFVFFASITPGSANTSEGFNEILPEPVFSQASGFYTSDFDLTLSTDIPGATIIYTLDGSDPDPANLSGTSYNYKNQYPMLPEQGFGPALSYTFTSNQYVAPIPIADRTLQPNKISAISSTYDFEPAYIPSVTIFKGTVVRAKVVKPGALSSKTVTRNYFITPLGNGRFTLPVVSLSIDENKLFDYDDGIYVAGKTFDEFRANFPSAIPNYPIGNYNWKGSDYERVANFSYFVGGSEKINQSIGIRVQGNYSRIYPRKSLNFYAKSDYGADNMHHQFFSDEVYDNFERLVIKNSGSDLYTSFFRDAFCSRFATPLRVQTEPDQPVVAFINGEYWGILTLREKYDNKFFERVYGIPDGQLDLLENDASAAYIEEGDNVDYLNMYTYIAGNSMVDEANFNYINTRMDVGNFTDYFITNIFLANEDWPANNIIFWRKKTPFSPGAPFGHDGRWRWAIHDMDLACYNLNLNTLSLASALEGPVPDTAWSTLILRKLLESPIFRDDFINRFADVLNTSFLPSRATGLTAMMKAQLLPEMPEQNIRWKAPGDMEQWNLQTDNLNIFLTLRPDVQRNQIREKFSIANNINVTVDVSNSAQGFVKVNTIDIKDGTPGIIANPYPWTGIYFSGIPIKLKAIPIPGYAFSHWTGASTAITDEITISSDTDITVTAVFVPAFSIEVSVPIAFWYINGAIANDTPLLSMVSSYEATSEATADFTSALSGYPFNPSHLNWRKASLERRNKPTPINYRPEANGGAAYLAGDMKGLQVTQPFQDNGLENTLVFSLPTNEYKNIKFSFAAMDEGAATGIVIDYSVNAGNPIWIASGLSATSFSLTTDVYQLYEADFSSVPTVNDNPNFKIRVRFTGPDMTASNGNRVTFNNVALDGVKLPLLYPSPNTFTVGSEITALVPTVAASVTSYSVSPALPDGLSLNATSGIVSGTPTSAMPIATYTITASNGEATASYGVDITVNDAAPSALSYASPNNFTVGSEIVVLNPTITGNVIGYSIMPQLPDGLLFDVITGAISGTPTTITPMAAYTVTAVNSGGNISFTIDIAVNDIAPSGLSYNSPNIFTINLPISGLYPTVGGNVIGYSVLPPLPEGLFLDLVTGAISGNPTAVFAAAAYTVTATNSGGSASFDIIITVNDVAPTSLSYFNPNVFSLGWVIDNLNPTVTGNITQYSVVPALPQGLSLDPVTGIISGTPTVLAGIATYTITAANSGGSVSFDIIMMVLPSLGLGHNLQNHFVVYPNPFTDSINVSGADMISFKLFSIDGRLIDSGMVSTPHINFGNLPGGLFLLQLRSGDAIETVKLIKK